MSKVNVKFRYNDQQPVQVRQTQPGPLVLNNLYDSYLTPQYTPIAIQQHNQPVKSSSLDKTPPKRSENAASQNQLAKNKSSHLLIAEEPRSQKELNARPVVQEVTAADMIRDNQQKREEIGKTNQFTEIITKKDVPKREEPRHQPTKKEQPQRKEETPFAIGPKPADANQASQKRQQRQIQINPLIPVGSQKNQIQKKKKQQVRAAYQYNGIPVHEGESKGGCCSWCGDCNCKKTQKSYPIRQ